MAEREALNMALQALETLMIERGSIYDKAITAIKESLAQPEQHQDWCASLTRMFMSMPPKPAPCNCKPPQRTWVGLTDEEINDMFSEALKENKLVAYVAKAIEAKLKEKNT